MNSVTIAPRSDLSGAPTEAPTLPPRPLPKTPSIPERRRTPAPEHLPEREPDPLKPPAPFEPPQPKA